MSLVNSWMSPAGGLPNGNSADVTIPSGAAAGHIAVVGLFTNRTDEIPVITPPDGTWNPGPVAPEVAGKGGGPSTFWKRLTAAETGTWTFDFDEVSNGCEAWSGLWSGRVASGNPINISVGEIEAVDPPAGVGGSALAGDDIVLGFNDWNGVAESVSGLTKAQEDTTTGAHLFYADGVTAGSKTYVPNPASGSNTYWYALLSLKAAGLAANAGPDQSVKTGDSVTLSGSASGGVAPYTYAWTQTGGTTVSLSSSTAQAPTFTAPASAGVLTFQLVATDSHGTASSADTVNISVSARPVGTPTAPIHTTIKSWLSGPSASILLSADSTAGNSLLALLTVRNPNVSIAPITDDAGNPWQFAASTSAVTGLGQPIRQFIYYTSSAHAATTLTATFLDSSSASVSGDGVIHVLEFPGDIGDPIGVNVGGNVGGDPNVDGVTVPSGASAIIVGGLGLGVSNRLWAISSGWTSSGHDGTLSDVDQYVGYKVPIDGPATTGPSWTRTAGSQTDSTQVTIGFSGGVSLPRVNPGAQQSVTVGAGVTLDPTASGGEGPYTWAWTQTQGPSVALSSNTAQNPMFTASAAGTYWFQVIATDSTGTSSAPATAVVIASSQATAVPLIRSGGQWVPAVIKVRIGGVWV